MSLDPIWQDMQIENVASIFTGIILIYVFSFFRSRWRWLIWPESLLHIGLTYLLFFAKAEMGWQQLRFLIFSTLIYWLLLKISRSWWIIAGFPLFLFGLSRTLPSVSMGDLAVLLGSQAPQIFASSGLMTSVPMVGLSYLVFRWIISGIELREGNVQLGSPSQFVTFTFFAPTFYIGPISSYELFVKSWKHGWSRNRFVITKAIARLIWGATKFYPLSTVFYQLTFSRGLILQDDVSPWLLLSGFFAYPAYLYLNFSGFTDLVVGSSALFGIAIEENFDRPYMATSLREFWRRWHMTLTGLLKRLIYINFFRIVKKAFGIHWLNISFIPATLLVFLTMAYWHGPSWNFFIFGSLHGMALIVERLLALNSRAAIHASSLWRQSLARIYVFCFLAFSFFFFENSPEKILKIIDFAAHRL